MTATGRTRLRKIAIFVPTKGRMKTIRKRARQATEREEAR